MFNRFVSPGINCFFYPFEGIVGRVSLRVKQLDVACETKTLDNVFVDAKIAIQYQIQQDKVGPRHAPLLLRGNSLPSRVLGSK